MELLAYLFIASGIVASMLMVRFNTQFVTHILNFLYRKKGIKFDHHESWASWFLLVYEDKKIVLLLVELASCPGCLSFHLAFWTSLAFWFLSPVSLWMIPAGTLFVPSLANYIFAHTTAPAGFSESYEQDDQENATQE